MRYAPLIGGGNHCRAPIEKQDAVVSENVLIELYSGEWLGVSNVVLRMSICDRALNAQYHRHPSHF